MDDHYTVENAKKFNWSSISGNLNPERISHLETYIEGTRILDAGCGGGAYVEFLTSKGLTVTGVDKYEQFLRVARQRGRKGVYIESDLAKLPFSNKEFDCTYCYDVLEHVDDQAAIKELARVTSKRLIIAVPKEDNAMDKFNLTFLHYQDKTHLRNYTKESLKELVSLVSHSNLRIFPELAVPARSLVWAMMNFNYSSPSSAFFKFETIRRKAFMFLLNKFLRKAIYKEIYTGLVAIVDL